MGRPPVAEAERRVKLTLRLPRQVIEHYRASGRGWQTRIADELERIVKRTPRRFSKMNSKSVIMLCSAACLLSLASVASAQEVNRTHEYRMWSAEQMINRLTEKFAKARNICGNFTVKVYMPRLSDECKAAVISAYPILTAIRETAMSGDAVRWAALIDIAHEMEVGFDKAANTASQAQ